ncbi:MAG: hypothetical protein R3202_09840, partial [Candidatus Competibacterales bacterium]|nr:hypothetical protein [Candidatus Competibacterales bacterium]
AQDAYEQKLARALGQVRHTLRRHKAPLQHIAPRKRAGALRRLLGRAPKPEPAATAARHDNEND